MTETELTFGKGTSYISDVQFRQSLSPNNRSMSILFDNFSVSILPGGPPIATRSLSICYPLIEIASAAKLSIDMRGAIILEAETNATFVFRALGETHVLDPLLSSGNDKSTNYLKSFILKVPAGSEDLRMTLFIVVEQGTSKHPGQASLTVDSMDLSLGP